jgi:hypothetical protein
LYENISKSYFTDPFYRPNSISMQKEGVINYKNLSKQIEVICNTVFYF